MRLRQLAAALLCVLTLSSCGVKTVTRSGADGRISISVPERFTSLPEKLTEQETVLEIGDQKKEQYLLILEEIKDGSTLELEQYADYVEEMAPLLVEEPVFDERLAMKIDGRTARCVPFSGMSGEENRQYYIYCINYEDAFIRIVSWMPKSLAEEEEDVFHEIAKSLKRTAAA